MKKLAKKQTGGKAGVEAWKKEETDKKKSNAMSELKYLKKLHTTDYSQAARRGDKNPMKTAQGSIQGYEGAHGKGSFMRDVKRAASQAYDKDIRKKGGAVKAKKK